MVKFSDLLVDKITAQTGVMSFGRQFDFHNTSIMYSLVTLTIDCVTSLANLSRRLIGELIVYQ